MQLRLQKCLLKDLEELKALSTKTFADAFEADNNPVDFQTYMNKAFAAEQLKAELKNEESSFYFVYLEEALTGYFKLNEGQSQTDIKMQDTLEIERIYVLAEFQGLRIGQWMMEEIKKLALAKEKTFIWLGVWEENTRAIGFYEKNGFRKFGKHPYYIGKDKQMDWLMRFDLQPNST